MRSSPPIAPHQATGWCSSITTRKRPGKSRCTCAVRTQFRVWTRWATSPKSTLTKLPLAPMTAKSRTARPLWCFMSPCTTTERTGKLGWFQAQATTVPTAMKTNVTNKAKLAMFMRRTSQATIGAVSSRLTARPPVPNVDRWSLDRAKPNRSLRNSPPHGVPTWAPGSGQSCLVKC